MKQYLFSSPCERPHPSPCASKQKWCVLIFSYYTGRLQNSWSLRVCAYSRPVGAYFRSGALLITFLPFSNFSSISLMFYVSACARCKRYWNSEAHLTDFFPWNEVGYREQTQSKLRGFDHELTTDENMKLKLAQVCGFANLNSPICALRNAIFSSYQKHTKYFWAFVLCCMVNWSLSPFPSALLCQESNIDFCWLVIFGTSKNG